MNTNHWPKRLYSLDTSRGIASLAVVLSHWLHFSYDGFELPSNFEYFNQPFYSVLKIFYEMGSYGVGYFFLLSGFIFFWLYEEPIKSKSISFKNFWLQRFSRLYPLHFVTLIIVAILQYFYSFEGNAFIYEFNDVYHFILNLGFASKWGIESGWSFNAPVWSVSIEILLYLVFFIVVFKNIGGVIFCLLISFISPILLYITDHAIFKGLALFFLGGVVFHITVMLSTKYNKLKYVVYCLSIVFWMLTLINFYIINLSVYILNIGLIGEVFIYGFPFFILFPLTICSLALMEIDKGNFLKSFSWIGDITYSSYLLHFPLELCFILAFNLGLIHASFHLNPFYLILFFIILIPMSYLTFVYFERPIQKLLRTKFYN